VTDSELFEQLATQATKMARDMPDARCRQLMQEIAERYAALAECLAENRTSEERG
jgi:hypothetical protein